MGYVGSSALHGNYVLNPLSEQRNLIQVKAGRLTWEALVHKQAQFPLVTNCSDILFYVLVQISWFTKSNWFLQEAKHYPNQPNKKSTNCNKPEWSFEPPQKNITIHLILRGKHVLQVLPPTCLQFALLQPHKVLPPCDDRTVNSTNKSSVCCCQPVSSHTSHFTSLPPPHTSTLFISCGKPGLNQALFVWLSETEN